MAKKIASQDPTPERGVFHLSPCGTRLIKAHRTQPPKEGWRVAALHEIEGFAKAAAERALAAVAVAVATVAKKGG